MTLPTANATENLLPRTGMTMTNSPTAETVRPCTCNVHSRSSGQDAETVRPCTCNVHSRNGQDAESNGIPSNCTDNNTSERDLEIPLPTSENSVDTSGDSFHGSILELIHELLPDWGDVADSSQISVEQVSGAMTNCVYFVTGRCRDGGSRKVVMRIYGAGVNHFIDRDQEIKWLRRLPNFSIGPLLLGAFRNGRFEQYIPSVTLTFDDIRMPETSRKIAEQMALLHAITRHLPPPEGTEATVWVNIDKWYALATRQSFDRWTKEQAERVRAFDLPRLRGEIDELKSRLTALNSPIVFAHNDMQYGNILRCDGTNELALVDFEYSGYNHFTFDIGSHWCEWMYNYHAESDAHRARFDCYPTPEQRCNFLRSYVETERSIRGVPPLSTEEVDRKIKALLVECDAFRLASYVMWGLWGLMQSQWEGIDFPYLEYGMERLETFREIKEQTYASLDTVAKSNDSR